MKIKRGSTSVRRLIFIADSSSTTGAGLANLAHNSAGLVAYYMAGDLTADVQITLVAATLGTFTSGGFVAVDNTGMPGWYEIGIPNAALDGGNEVAIQLRGATNMVPVQIYIELDAIDYQTAIPTPLDAAATRAALGLAAADLDAQLIGIAIDADAVEQRLTSERAGYLNNLSGGAVALQSTLNAAASNITSILGKFTGITLLARWLGALAGKTADSTTLAEINATTAGAGFNNTTDSLQAISDAGGGGGGETTVSVVVPASVAAASQNTDEVTIVRGDTMRRSWTALGNISTRTKLWFTAKNSKQQEDADALIQIEETEGLLTINGEPAETAALGSITVTNATTGAITVYLDESLTAELAVVEGAVFDISWLGATDVTTPVDGSFSVTADVTRAVS